MLTTAEGRASQSLGWLCMMSPELMYLRCLPSCFPVLQLWLSPVGHVM